MPSVISSRLAPKAPFDSIQTYFVSTVWRSSGHCSVWVSMYLSTTYLNSRKAKMSQSFLDTKIDSLQSHSPWIYKKYMLFEVELCIQWMVWFIGYLHRDLVRAIAMDASEHSEIWQQVPFWRYCKYLNVLKTANSKIFSSNSTYR